MPVDRLAVLEEARKYIGVPWRHQGRTEHGVDCVGLIAVVAKTLGLSDYDYTNYTRRQYVDRNFIRHFKDNSTPKSITNIIPGDVLVFSEKTFPCHTGILSEKHGVTTLIHAYALSRMVVEVPFSEEWKAKLIYAFCFIGLEDSPWPSLR